MADAVENALVLRERTFAARTALASRMRVPGRSRRWENAVLGWEVRPRSDVGGVSTRTAPPESRRTRGAVCRSQARAASDARPPGRRWPADWRTEPRACCRVGSCEACETHGTCDGAVGDCVRCTGPRGMCSYAVRNCDSAELRMSVPVGMIGASPFGSFPRNTCSVLAGEERSWEGGEGRVQAESPERESPPGQGNGPEGERRFDLYRSPDPGRWCPGGCPEQVVQLRLTAC